METPFIIDKGTTLLSRDLDDYPGGLVIVVDKPYLWTSADVIRKIRVAASRHFALRKLKVGHAGTLDPLATGVLLVCIGNATKLSEQLQSHDKEYVAGINFGATTPSYDLEQDIDREFPYDHITEDAVRETLRGFIGEQEQIAPLFSAKSVEGVRAYEIARKLYKQQGRDGGFDSAANDLIRTARIVISEAELLDFHPATGSCATDIPDILTAETEKGSETSPNIPAAESGLAVLADNNGNGNSDCEAQNDVEKENTEQCEAYQGETKSLVGNNYAEQKELNEEWQGTIKDTYRQNNETQDKKLRTIHVADVSQRGYPHATVRIVCSKGTYIRAFARDLGEALNTGAHLNSLQRSRSGDFLVSRAISIPDLISLLAQ